MPTGGLLRQSSLRKHPLCKSNFTDYLPLVVSHYQVVACVKLDLQRGYSRL
nr:MAG TPA: hypothetical protein [Caudoviricetes sp.]DAU53267.1 MAG TPA: hypothetical protein [Caudoviricetes sp.]